MPRMAPRKGWYGRAFVSLFLLYLAGALPCPQMQVEDQFCVNYDLKDKNGVLHETDLFPKDLARSIKNIVKEEGYIKHEVDTKRISTEGGSYLGDLYEVNIKGTTSKGEKETNVFVKHIISFESNNNKIFSVNEVYFKESFTYKEISKMFIELQNEANVPAQERFKMPKSYDETNTEAIFLENLAKKGYATLYRMDVMPLRFAELGIEQLAKFHGLFYVLENKRPDYFKENLKKWKHPFIFGEEWKAFMENSVQFSINELTPETKKKVDKFVPKMLEKLPFYELDTNSTGCTIVHSDYRTNNALVKIINGEITDVVPVDYQLLHYGCPINDLIYFIFNGSDKEFRKNHLDNLVNLYYDQLTKFLKYFNMDANDIYTKKEYLRLYKERLDLGLMYALYCTPFIFTKEDQVPDIGKDDMTKFAFVLNSRYKERVQGIVDDFIEWSIL